MKDRRRDAELDREQICELDLMAYVDGRLDDDPHRKDIVERYLEDNPEQASRVADFKLQNEALRALDSAWLSAPVPDRLIGTVYADDDRRRVRKASGMAAAAAIFAIASIGGWVLGSFGSQNDELRSFATSALADHVYPSGQDAEIAVAGGLAPSLQGTAPLTWLTRRISVRLRVPDLAAHGYELIKQDRVRLDDEFAARLTYHGRDGNRVNIYLRPRWKEGPAPLNRTDGDGRTALYWFDGPLAVAMTATDGASGNVENLVSAVRQAIAEVSVVEPDSGIPFSQDAQLMDSEHPRPTATESTIERPEQVPGVRAN